MRFLGTFRRCVSEILPFVIICAYIWHVFTKLLWTSSGLMFRRTRCKWLKHIILIEVVGNFLVFQASYYLQYCVPRNLNIFICFIWHAQPAHWNRWWRKQFDDWSSVSITISRPPMQTGPQVCRRVNVLCSSNFICTRSLHTWIV